MLIVARRYNISPLGIYQVASVDNEMQIPYTDANVIILLLAAVKNIQCIIGR